MWETLHPWNTLTCNIVLANTKLANDNYYRLKVWWNWNITFWLMHIFNLWDRKYDEIEILHFDWCISLTSVIESMMKLKYYILIDSYL